MAGAPPSSTSCPACGATLGAANARALVRCPSCKREVHPRPAQGPPSSIYGSPSTVTTKQTRRAISMLLGVPVVLVLLGVLVNRATQRSVAPPKSTSLPAPSVEFISDPVVAAIDGDEVEDVVGLVREPGADGRAPTLAAFSGATFKELWRGAAFSQPTEVRIGIAGAFLVVVDAGAMVHVYARDTGKETGTLKVADRADRICGAASGEAWILLAGGQGAIVDAKTLKVRIGPRPSWCPRACIDLATHASCEQSPTKPQIEGVVLDRALVEDKIGVAVGIRAPGAAVPTIVGFDPQTFAQRWVSPLPDAPADERAARADDLADVVAGVAYAIYSRHDDSADVVHLASFDGMSGARNWDVVVSRAFAELRPRGVVATATRVYVPISTVVYVLSARDGAPVGTIGKL